MGDNRIIKADVSQDKNIASHYLLQRFIHSLQLQFFRNHFETVWPQCNTNWKEIAKCTPLTKISSTKYNAV